MAMNPVTQRTFGVFSHGSSFSYNAMDRDDPASVNRNNGKDVFMEEVLHKRFSRHLHILAYYPEHGAAATPPPPSAEDNLRIEGIPEVGQRLTVTGWYTDSDPANCTYQWFSGDEEIPGATSNTYVVQERDQGNMVMCRVFHNQEEKEAYANVSQAKAIDPGFSLESLTVTGGPDHLDPIKVVATYTDGLYHPGEVQWFRADSMGGEYLAVKHRNDETYMANADDLHCMHYVYYKVLEGLSAGQIAKGTVHPHFLSINHDVATAVEGHVAAGSATFDVETEDGGRRVITINNHKLTVTDPNFVKVKGSKAKATIETKHHGAIRVLLNMVEDTHFNLSIPPEAPLQLVAKTRQERDVIALTIRSFVAKVVTNYEATKNKKKLHTTHSMAELGHDDKHSSNQA